MIKLNCPEHPRIKAARESVSRKYLASIIDRNDIAQIKIEVSNALRREYDTGRIFPPGVNHSSIPDQLYLECAQLADPSIRINDITSTEFEVAFDHINGILKIIPTIMVDRVVDRLGGTQNAN